MGHMLDSSEPQELFCGKENAKILFHYIEKDIKRNWCLGKWAFMQNTCLIQIVIY